MAITYKMAFLSPNWTSRVVSRVVRDAITIQRICRVNGIVLIVAANRDLAQVLRGVQGIKSTTDVSECEIYRLYVDESIPRKDGDPDPDHVVPEDVWDYDTISVSSARKIGQLVVDPDPYAGVKLPDRFTRIPNTMDRYLNAPKPIAYDEPSFGFF